MQVGTILSAVPVTALPEDLEKRPTQVSTPDSDDLSRTGWRGMFGLTTNRVESPAPLRVVTIETESQFLDLRDKWNSLAETQRRRSLFFFHEWFHAAWEWRKLDSGLAILCAYAGDTLVGVLPLIFSSIQTGFLPLRRLELLTVPDTQLCDLIVAEEQTDAVVGAFVDELTRKRSQWDELRLDYLMEDACAGAALRDALGKHGFRSEVRERGRNLSIPLDMSWTDYYNARSRSLKKANNLAGNRLKKRGEIAVEWLEPGTRDQGPLNAALDAVTKISCRSWKHETGTTLDQTGPGAFIRRLSELASRQGWLSIWILKLNGEPLAMEYQLIFEGQVHALRADFDASCTDFSPGSYLSHHLLQELFRRRLNHYYMGPGENTYKLRWSSNGESLSQLVVFGRTLRGRAEWMRETVVNPKVRRLIAKVRSVKGRAAASSGLESTGEEE